MEFARVCRQVIDVINLRKLTNRQFENSKQLSITSYSGRKRSIFFGKQIRQIRKASSLLLIPTHFYLFLPIATHWRVLRVHDNAGFSKNQGQVKTCMHLYAFVIICYGMYTFAALEKSFQEA